MSQIMSTSSLYSTGATTAQSSSSNLVDTVDFLRILVVQLQNQDPLSPMDDTQFVTQLAQFSMLEGINALGTSYTQTKGLQLIGKQVVAVCGDSESVISGTVTCVTCPEIKRWWGIGDQYVSLDDSFGSASARGRRGCERALSPFHRESNDRPVVPLGIGNGRPDLRAGPQYLDTTT
jgi:flagellar basal-body rod modification protein FlgD